MRKLFLWLVACVGLAAITALSGCSKPESVGLDLLPPGDTPGVFYTDTITITAETIREDSLRTDEGIVLFNLAGSMNDPVFGQSEASFYSQIRLPNNNTNFSFGTSPVLDSVVLTLAYADSYGDTTTMMEFQVYKLDTLLQIDSAYYSNQTSAVSDLLATVTSEIHPKDSVNLNGTNVAPHLRLRLPDSEGQKFLDAGDATFIDNSTFFNFFKGIHVKTTQVTGSGQGCILSFNLLSALSKLTFYYRANGDTTQLTANFEVNTECPRYNYFEHDYSVSAFGNNFPVPGDMTLYLQSMAGVKVRLKFPYLRDLTANGALSINKAELFIPVEDNAIYRNHQNMVLFGVDSAGKEALIPDLLESINYYGGSYVSDDNAVKFNINRYVQRIVSGKIVNDYGLSLVSAGGGYNAFRSVIPGPVAPSDRIRLRLTYSKLH